MARILVIDDDRLIGAITRQVLINAGYEVVMAISGEEGYAIAVQEAANLDLIVTDLVLPGMDGYMLCRQIRQQPTTHSLPILMLTSQEDIAHKIAGFEAGVDDYLVKPFESGELISHIKELLMRVQQTTPTQSTGAKRGQVIAVFGCKGGLGKTTIAVNLAVALRGRRAGEVVLFDADFLFGDIGVHFNQPRIHSILDLVRLGSNLSPAAAARFLVSHSCGVRLLLSPNKPEETEFVTPPHIRQVLDFLTQYYDYIVVDCATNCDERTLLLLEQASMVLVVTTPQLGPLRNTRVFLDLMQRIELPSEKFHLLLNRADTNAGADIASIERGLNHPIAFQFASGGVSLVESVNQSVPLLLAQPHGSFSQQILRLTDYVMKAQAAVSLSGQAKR